MERMSRRKFVPGSSQKVCLVAAIPRIRHKLVELQQRMAETEVIMDGRDIGTVVMPDAELKFFITADPLARAARRGTNQGNESRGEIYDVLNNLVERDRIDSSRAVSLASSRRCHRSRQQPFDPRRTVPVLVGACAQSDGGRMRWNLLAAAFASTLFQYSTPSFGQAKLPDFLDEPHTPMPIQCWALTLRGKSLIAHAAHLCPCYT